MLQDPVDSFSVAPDHANPNPSGQVKYCHINPNGTSPKQLEQLSILVPTQPMTLTRRIYHPETSHQSCQVVRLLIDLKVGHEVHVAVVLVVGQPPLKQASVWNGP